ncbi:hypothetical protein [Acetobacter persici]|uniref:hypothetical protein n=1 Tax=Acetobacter persici TaxID=1076596 RepID=UPI001BAC22FE|nr:hypothetical protein [Acetobacter persici]MBS1017248.1 hypothetical protein [Acetobacter persici]
MILKTLKNGNNLCIGASVMKNGSVTWGKKYKLVLAETLPETDFTRANGKNIVAIHAEEVLVKRYNSVNQDPLKSIPDSISYKISKLN